MGKLIIEGDDKVLQIIMKSNRLRIKKHNLKASLQLQELSQDKSNQNNDDDLPKGANDRIELINEVTEIEDLKPFESDERATVKKAYDAKLQELSQDK